jgi:hypothetical protein
LAGIDRRLSSDVTGRYRDDSAALSRRNDDEIRFYDDTILAMKISATVEFVELDQTIRRQVPGTTIHKWSGLAVLLCISQHA